MTDKPNDWRERFNKLWDASPEWGGGKGFASLDEGEEDTVVVSYDQYKITAFIQSEMERVEQETIGKTLAIVTTALGMTKQEMSEKLEAQAKSGGEDSK